ncbi:MAG: DUF86 domain-containing protein [Proteobacteria bacterium]|nr:DUF86 domain-containing protein [Pseudomonadota bacterium]
MLDRERILAKFDELEGYQKELAAIAPKSFEEFRQIQKKRACERLLQISVEAAIDVCHLFVAGLRLGLPAEEDDIFEKLEHAGIISSSLKDTLKEMKGFRNILVHEYGEVDDQIVYEAVTTRLRDFDAFRREVLKALEKAEPL